MLSHPPITTPHTDPATKEVSRPWVSWYQEVSKQVTAAPSIVAVPASANHPGNTGQVAADENYLYYCTAKNTWSRYAKGEW